MTKYLNEYDPKSQNLDRLIQSDIRKLKFNNIQSCLALVVVPADGSRLIGVHITRWTTKSPASTSAVCDELKRLAGGQCNGYMIATWSYYSESSLLKELKKFCRTVSLCSIPEPKLNYGADIDVKVELSGGMVSAWIRRHAIMLKTAKGGSITKPGFDVKTAEPGKPSYQTDAGPDKPWMGVTFAPA